MAMTPLDLDRAGDSTTTGGHAYPAVAVDILLFAGRARQLHVLLVRRRHPPFAGRWAIPGGFVGLDESLEKAARRELREETGIAAGTLQQLRTFGDPDRDPRGRVISVVYWGLLDGEDLSPAQGGDDAAEARWWPVDELPPLAFDHDRILAYALARPLSGWARGEEGLAPEENQ